MIIKWDAGVLLYEDEDGILAGRVNRRWKAGSIEFREHWMHLIDDKCESFVRYDQITHVNFYGRVVVSWYAKEWSVAWTFKARKIYDEIMVRARALFMDGKGAGQLVGDVS